MNVIPIEVTLSFVNQKTRQAVKQVDTRIVPTSSIKA